MLRNIYPDGIVAKCSDVATSCSFCAHDVKTIFRQELCKIKYTSSRLNKLTPPIINAAKKTAKEKKYVKLSSYEKMRSIKIYKTLFFVCSMSQTCIATRTVKCYSYYG